MLRSPSTTSARPMPGGKRALDGGQLRRAAGLDLRAARPQRRGQVDADQHPGGAGQQDQRERVDLGLRHRRAPPERQGVDRHRQPGNPVRPLLHAVRDAGDPGRALRRPQARATQPRTASRRPPGGQGRRVCPNPVRRHEAPADGRQGDGPFAPRPRPRRADRGRRHRTSPAALGLCPRTERRRASRWC